MRRNHLATARWDGGCCQVAGRGSGCSGSRCWAGTGGVGGSWRLAVAPGEGAGCAGRCALGLVGAGGAGSVRCGCACAEPSGVRLRPEARRERLRPARRLVRRPGQPPAVAAAGIGSAGPGGAARDAPRALPGGCDSARSGGAPFGG